MRQSNLKVIGLILLTGCISFLQAQKWKWSYPYPLGYSLNCASFLDNNKGYIVGDYGTILETSDGGATWNIQSSANLNNLNGVDFPDKNLGIAVGNNGTILRTTDGGLTWIDIPADGHCHYLAVDMTNELTGFTIAWNPFISQGQIFKTLDGGLTWGNVYSSAGHLYDISAPSTDTVYAGGYNGIFCKTINGGASWVKQDIGTTIYAIDFINSLHGVVVGHGNGEEDGFSAVTYDGGNTWESSLLYPYWYFDVHLISDSIGYAIMGNCGSGWDAVVIKTLDGGLNWEWDFFDSPGEEMDRIFFINDTAGFSAGPYGRITKTTDGCDSWQPASSMHSDNFKSIVTTSKDKAIAGGYNSMVKTFNGGNNWEIELPYFFNGYEDPVLFFINEQRGFAADRYGYFYETNDGGYIWIGHPFPADRLSSISIPQGSDSGIVVGNSGAIIKFDIVYLHYRSIYNGPPGVDLYSVHFPVEDTGYVAGEGGNVWRAINGGHSWKKLDCGTSNPLNSVYFTDPLTGYVVGGGGLIFKTTNGGENWSQQTSNTLAGLNSIDFYDSEFGYIVGDSGTILHTKNGGLNWKIELSPCNLNLKSVDIYDTSLVYIAGDHTILKYSVESFNFLADKPGRKPLAVKIFPNPSASGCKVSFYLEQDGFVDLSLFDLSGNKVSAVFQKILARGPNTVTLDLESLPAGIYFLRLSTNQGTVARKLVVSS